MRMKILTAIAFLASFTSGTAMAQENNPTIIPEELQKLALTFPISERLKIDWNKPEPEDVGRYLGFLSAVNEVALAVATSRKDEKPTEADFLAALSIECIWPNNKPPLVEKSWPFQQQAFYSISVRQAIRDAVGPLAKQLPDRIEKVGQKKYAASGGVLPEQPDDYYKDVFDIKRIPGVK